MSSLNSNKARKILLKCPEFVTRIVGQVSVNSIGTSTLYNGSESTFGLLLWLAFGVVKPSEILDRIEVSATENAWILTPGAERRVKKFSTTLVTPEMQAAVIPPLVIAAKTILKN